MKSDLLDLIQQIDKIKSYFHVEGGDGIPKVNVIYDIPEFCVWDKMLQLELQDIHDRTKDQFIWNTLVITKQKFNGWNDETIFNELAGSLVAISKNINKYYPTEAESSHQAERNELTMSQKSPKVFISHSSLDKDYVAALVDLLEAIGLNEQQIFCSSISGYGIPLDEDIYDYLKLQFDNHELHVILVLSDNYYESVACMNEMGAAWMLQSKYTTVLLPGFEFKNIKGAINPRKIGLKLDNDSTDVKEKLGQLKDSLLEEFDLSPIKDVRWESKRDNFINAISKLNVPNSLSQYALSILESACVDPQGTIIKSVTLSGLSITVGRENFVISQERREVAKWESALVELSTAEFIQQRGAKGEIFVVAQKGYEYIELLHK